MKLRPDAYYDLQAIIAEGLQRIATENHIYTTCLNCQNFIENIEICKLANAKPPARVIVMGCPQWDGGVPF